MYLLRSSRGWARGYFCNLFLKTTTLFDSTMSLFKLFRKTRMGKKCSLHLALCCIFIMFFVAKIVFFLLEILT
jgi:hypothetical protein